MIGRWFLRSTCPWAILLLSCSNIASAQETTERSLTARALTIKGDNLTEPCELASKQLRISGKPTPFEQLVRVDWFKRRIRPASHLIVLSNGDQIAATPNVINEDALIAVRENREVRIPLEFIRVVMFRMPETTAARSDRWQEVRENGKEDIIHLQGGDTLQGELLELSAGSVRIDTRNGETTIPVTRISSIRFSSELITPVPNKNRIAILQTIQDDILSVSTVMQDENGIRLETTSDAKLVVSLDSIRRIQFCHDKVRLLAELPPKKSEHVPILGGRKTWQPNRNVRQLPLRSTEREPLGIGVTSGLRVSWQLDGTAQTLHTLFGLDDLAQRGAAIFVIEADGRELFRSKVTRRNKAHQAPELSLKGARELTLAVEYGPNGDLNDMANWLSPVLVRSED